MAALMKRILNVSGKYKGKIQIAFIFAFLKSMLSKAPIGIAFMMFSAFIANNMTAVICLYAGVGIIISLVLQMLFQYIADKLQSTAGYMAFADKRKDLGKHLRKMPMGYFTEGNIGKISSVLSTDMTFIEENCMQLLADMMSELFAAIVMVAFLFYFSPWIGITGVVISAILILIGQGTVKLSLKESIVKQEQSENLTEAVLDFVEGIGIIKTYNMLGEKSKELTETFKETRKKSIHFEKEYTPWARRINLAIAIGVAITVGVTMVLYNQSMISTSYVIGMLLFVFELYVPLRALYGNTARLTVMDSCMDRIEEVFDECELADQGTKTIPDQFDGAEIAFENVSFAYDKKEVLHKINFQVNRNEMCALVGPSGGGKSTVANLIARFWDVNSGKVFIRGVDVKDMQLSELMNHISMVFQRVYLFQDTIYNNISMGRPNATREEVFEAAKKACCYDFIMALPNGFDTLVGEGGASLSGGEQQRISIARCILKDAPIVILDEATASVDADNERYIQRAISELCKGKTLIVIAHRLNTIQEANQIVVINQGQIEQQGSHQELLKKEGTYKKFVQGRQKAVNWKFV